MKMAEKCMYVRKNACNVIIVSRQRIPVKLVPPLFIVLRWPPMWSPSGS